MLWFFVAVNNAVYDYSFRIYLKGKDLNLKNVKNVGKYCLQLQVITFT